jgi:hypothetical protein
MKLHDQIWLFRKLIYGTTLLILAGYQTKELIGRKSWWL